VVISPTAGKYGFCVFCNWEEVKIAEQRERLPRQTLFLFLVEATPALFAVFWGPILAAR
jgi:hypothetical protein